MMLLIRAITQIVIKVSAAALMMFNARIVKEFFMIIFYKLKLDLLIYISSLLLSNVIK